MFGVERCWLRGYGRSTEEREKDVLVDLSILVETRPRRHDGRVLKFKSDLVSVEKASGRGGYLTGLFGVC